MNNTIVSAVLSIFSLGILLSISFMIEEVNAQNTTSTNASSSTVSIACGSSLPSNAEFFVPAEITVSAGTTITSVNNDSTIHTVVAGTAANPVGQDDPKFFDSGILAMGQTFEHQFNEPGEYPYYCSLHPFMEGKVIVQ